MKQLKPLKKVPFFIVSPIISMIGEVLFIFALLSVLDALVFNKRNMASFFMAAVIGGVIWAFFGLIEYLMRKRWDMKWYLFGIGVYLIPIACWAVLTLVTYTYWYSNRLSENAEFLMYLTRTMLLYISWAAAFRFGGHLICFLAGGGLRKKSKKQKG